MVLTKSKRTWHGRTVKEGTGLICELRQSLPYFTKSPLRLGQGENQYLSLISRDPLIDLGDAVSSKDRMSIPVAAVSRSEYQLVQHHRVLDSVLSALRTIENQTRVGSLPDPELLHAELRLSEYGARMWLSFLLPRYGFDPGDGRRVELKVNCLNSMDSSFAVRVHLSWCRTGSPIETMGPEFRQNHNQSFRPSQIETFLTEQLNQLSEEEDRYRRWYRTEFRKDPFTDWIDQTVAKKWGADTAARAHHIVNNGSDCKVVDKRKKTEVKAHELDVEKTRELFELLGFRSAKNTYHIHLVLSWLANEKEAIEEQLKRTRQISDLLAALL